MERRKPPERALGMRKVVIKKPRPFWPGLPIIIYKLTIY